MAERNLAIRLSVIDGGKVKAEFSEIGEAGDKVFKRIASSSQPATKAMTALNAAANDVKGSAIGLSSQIGPLGSAMVALGPAGIAAGAGLGAMALMLKKSFDEASQAEQAQNRLQGVLKATGYASGLTGKDIADMAEEMEHSTLTTAESVKGAAAIMATFRSVSGDTFKQSIHLAQDMSAVFGQDLSSSATQLGKALEDPIEGLTALRRVGVSFSDTQKELIKNFVETGDKAQAQKVILAALEQQVGGAAEAEAKGLTGAVHRMSVAWGDMLKAIGKTDTFTSVAQAALQQLQTTFEVTTEWVTKDPISLQLDKKKKELAEVQKALDWLYNLPPIVQPLYKDNIKVRVDQATQLRTEIEKLTKAEQDEAAERAKAAAGKLAAEREARAEQVMQKNKASDDTLAKLMDDPAEKIAKINKELAITIQQYEKLREPDNSNAGAIAEGILKAREVARRQIEDVNKPLKEAAERDALSNAKVIDDLQRQLLGMQDARQAFIDQAVSRLSEKADDATKAQTRDLAAQLFDEKAFADAQKVMDDLEKQMDRLGDKRQAFVDEYLDRLPATASQEQIDKTKELAAAFYDQSEAQAKLDQLQEEGKQLTDELRTSDEAYADQIEHLTELLNAGAISQEVFNKAKDKADDTLFEGRTDAQAGAIRAFHKYQEEAENSASAVEKAFSDAMKATEDAIVNMVTTGKISFDDLESFADSVVADITRMMVQKSITGPLFNWLGSQFEDDGGFFSDILSAIMHEGGVAGDMYSSRQVPAYVFAGAPRYHSGGIAGLQPGEIPAILQRGEIVLPKNGRASTPISVVMNISTSDANSFRASQAQIAAEAARGIQRARRNL